jgi:hypothetical protein
VSASACGFDGAATGDAPCTGPTCAAAATCATNNGGCAADALCAETRGAPTCTCKGGFSGDGKACALATLTLAADTDLSTTSTGARACADGGDMVAYSVTALTATAATLASPVSAGCLSPGDDVIVINLQGTTTSSVNTGSYESLVVKAVTASTVSFASAKTMFFGDGAADDANLGTSVANQRVALQRVPRYGNLVVAAGVKITAAAWDGTKGGLLALSAGGSVTLDGQLVMDGRGYRGGAVNTVASTTGAQGESIDGPGLAATQPSSAGRGGGGRGDNTGCLSFGAGGGGGGHGAPGSAAERPQCGGAGGGAYGDDVLTRLFLGSGGGAGGTDNTLVDNTPGGYGGAGGGIVFVRAAGAVKGALASRGAAGQGAPAGIDCAKASTASCWDYSGPGGGGAGGSILVAAASFVVATDASGGAAGNGFSNGAKDGGAGGVGRVKTP